MGILGLCAKGVQWRTKFRSAFSRAVQKKLKLRKERKGNFKKMRRTNILTLLRLLLAAATHGFDSIPTAIEHQKSQPWTSGSKLPEKIKKKTNPCVELGMAFFHGRNTWIRSWMWVRFRTWVLVCPKGHPLSLDCCFVFMCFTMLFTGGQPHKTFLWFSRLASLWLFFWSILKGPFSVRNGFRIWVRETFEIWIGPNGA